VSELREEAKRTLAVLFGGRSLEHDVSVVSGLQILQAIDPDRFNAMPVYIDHASRWWIGDDAQRIGFFPEDDAERFTETVTKEEGNAVSLAFQGGTHCAIGYSREGSV